MATKRPPYERQNKMLVALTMKYLSLGDMKPEDLAVRVHVCRATMYNRLRKPGSLTLDELRRMVNTLGFTDEEKLQVL